jgi:hypothetical protein
MPNHGVYATQQTTSIATPSTADVGIPYVIGNAPLKDAESPAEAGVPVLCTSWSEAVEQLGYSDDWETYPLCEVMYYHFKLASCQPVIFYVTGDDKDTVAGVGEGIEAIDLCLSMFGIVPDLMLCPKWSHEATVAALMAAKASNINGLFRAKALIDPTDETYTAAIQSKNAGSYTEEQVLCWPIGTLGDYKFHMSTIFAGRAAETDTDNGAIPYESPSNKAVSLDGLVTPSGKPLNLSKAQADILNNNGIVTAINFMGGWVLWGNYTACYPTNTDVKDYMIPISRMFDYVSNTLIKTFWSKLDKPMNKRLISTILDSANIWLNGLVGAGYLLGARVEMLDEENPLTNLMAGVIKFHVYLTPPGPAQEIDFVLEYDTDYVTAALS